MTIKKTLIVITNYGKFQSLFKNPNKLKYSGVECTPIFNNGNWLLPLGWEDVITEYGIEYIIEEVDYIQEEI